MTTLPIEGQVVGGRYRVSSELGRGGMGTVFEAEHILLRHRVALKVLQPTLSTNEVYRERFLREAQAAKKVISPHVIDVFDFGEAEGGLLYFTMELLRGQDFESYLRQRGPLPWAELEPIFLQITSAVRAAHDNGIVHRDIKPANCFLCEDPVRQPWVKMLDFGIAKLTDAVHARDALTHLTTMQSLTSTGQVLGTVSYMAPELVTGTPADVRSDIYALGVMMFRALAGALPFRGETPFAVFEQHIKAPVPPLRGLNPTVSAAVEAIVLRMLEKDPNRRFQAVAELDDALLMARRGGIMLPPVPWGRPEAASSPPPAPKSPSPDPVAVTVIPPPARRIPVFAVIVFLPVAVVIAGMGYWFGRSGSNGASDAVVLASGEASQEPSQPLYAGESSTGTGTPGGAPPGEEPPESRGTTGVDMTTDADVASTSAGDGATLTVTDASSPKAIPKRKPKSTPLTMDQRAGRDCPAAIGEVFSVLGIINDQGAFTFESVDGGKTASRVCIGKFVKTLRFPREKGKTKRLPLAPRGLG